MTTVPTGFLEEFRHSPCDAGETRCSIQLLVTLKPEYGIPLTEAPASGA